MPAHRKPSAVLAFTGAFKQNPSRGRAREGEPVPRAPIGETPPAHLSPEVAKAWAEIVALCPAGVLADCDVFAVEMAARLLTMAREDREDNRPIIAGQQVLRWLCELGMTPASRSKVKCTVDEAKEEAAPDAATPPASFGAC